MTSELTPRSNSRRPIIIFSLLSSCDPHLLGIASDSMLGKWAVPVGVEESWNVDGGHRR